MLALIGFGQALTTIAIAVALCGIVTALTAGATGVLAGTPAQSLSHLLPATTGAAIIVLAVSFAARGALSWAEQVVAQRTAARVTHELRQSLLDRVVRRGPAWVAAYGTGRLTTVLGSGLEALRPWFSGYLPALVLGLLLPPLVVVIMAVVDPASATVTLFTLPLIPLLGALIGWATKARAEQRWAADSRLAGHFLDVVRGLPTLKMYGRAERQIDVIADLTDRHRAATMRVLRVAFLSSTALDLVGTLAVGLIAVQAGLRVAAGSMELGPALLVILLAPEAYRPLREMAARYHASTDAGAVIADVDEILSPLDHATPAAAPSPSRPTPPSPAPAAHRPQAPEPQPPAPALTHHRPHALEPEPPSAAAAHRVRALEPQLPAPAPVHYRPQTPEPPSAAFGPAVPAGRSRDVTGLSSAFGHVTPYTRDPFGQSGRITTATPLFGRAAAGRWGVRAAGIRARYPNAFEDALHLPELAVRAGEVVALRGLSGAGKTTALRVLAGLHPAEAGAIAVGSVFYLPQRPSLPHARTVADAFPPDTTAAEMSEALHLAGLTGEVTAQTPLGEQVAGVSAGQRQRLALAVLLHRATRTVAAHRDCDTAPVVTLLLDEPTAHLDSAAEHQVIERLHEFAAQGCAVLVVAHRPALLAAADRIVDVHPPAGTVLSRFAVTAAFTNPLELPSWAATPPAGTPPAPTDSEFPAGSHRCLDAVETTPTTSQEHPAGSHRCLNTPETTPTTSQQHPAGSHRCLHTPEATATTSQEHPAGSHRCLNAVETTATTSQGHPAGSHRCLHTPEATATTSQEHPAGSHRCLNAVETTATTSQGHPAGSHRCLDGVETAVGTSRGTAGGARRCLCGVETAATASRPDDAEAAASADGRTERRETAGGRWWARLWVAAGLGAGSSVAGIVLTGAAAWLLVRASSLPPVLSLSTAVVLVRGSAVARPLLRYLERLVSHEVAFARLGRRRAAVYAGLIPHVPGPRLHRRGDLLTRLVDDVDAATEGLLRGRLPLIAAAVTAGLAVAVVAWVAAGAAVPMAVGLLVAGLFAPMVAARQADRQEAATGAARAALRDAVVETVDGVEELAGGGGRPDVPGKRSRALADLESRAARGAGLAAAVAHVGWGAAVAGVAVVLGSGGLTAEWSAVVLLGVVVLGEAVVALPEAAIARRRAAGAGRRVASLIENGPAVDSGELIAPLIESGSAATSGERDMTHAGTPSDSASRVSGEQCVANAGAMGGGVVRVSGLVAGWDAGRVPVLDGVTLELTAGSRTAIMGRSGCGKSTLAAVLAGLLPPTAGNVQVSGAAVLVGEETGHVFASTVRENLRLASPAATDPQLRAVLARVGLGWMDLDAWLGAGGGTISGGQRRRLATARALLADPALLILDEPTEGIDEAGAREMMMDLLSAASGRTVLVLAHRTDGLDLVDRVLELDANGLKEKNVGLDRSVR
ncbi:thiol reductant ABC exporter CydC subunit [Actinoplanes xinjiangensis]|uniref:Thiol reductant ABC exporter CydC subunit n=1 Tax=Actinoplanes xinjiangensis TaxID=512350 RepID=A0A316F8Q3_9ACTN|nr:thiol reductant ABC exporter CydC subunit [Actinoplanes xinjiangensis]